MHAQALALLQWRAGRLQEARQMFQEATNNCKPHAPLWAAWASVEVRARPGVRMIIPVHLDPTVTHCKVSHGWHKTQWHW